MQALLNHRSVIMLLCGAVAGMWACNDTQNISKNRVTLRPDKVIEIDIDKSAASFSNQIQPVSLSNQEHLLVENKFSNSIDIYNLHTKRIQRRIVFEQEGPNGIGKIDGFWWVSADSIFVHRKGSYTIYLANQHAKVCNTYHLIKGSMSAATCMPIVSTNRPMTVHGDYLYLSGIADDTRSNHALKEGKNCIRLNLKSGAFEYFMPFPKEYFSVSNWSFYYTQAFGTFNPYLGHWVSSFVASPSLCVADTSGRIVSTHTAAGAHMPNEIIDHNPFRNTDNQVAEAMYFYKNQARYESIVFDKFRRVYYRFATKPTAQGKNENDAKIEKYIIIISEAFEIIGEFRLDATFSVTSYFILPEGIYIQQENTANENFTFRCFRLQTHNAIRL